MPFGSTLPRNIGSQWVDFDKGNGLDRQHSSLLPHGPYKASPVFCIKIFPEKEKPYNHSYKTDRSVDPQEFKEVSNQMSREKHS